MTEKGARVTGKGARVTGKGVQGDREGCSGWQRRVFWMATGARGMSVSGSSATLGMTERLRSEWQRRAFRMAKKGARVTEREFVGS